MKVPDLITRHLLSILSEIQGQNGVAAFYPKEQLSFHEEMNQIKEFIEVDEAGLAYESLVATLENMPFVLSSAAAIHLLEVGLLMGFKTQRPEDAMFKVHQLLVASDGLAALSDRLSRG